MRYTIPILLCLILLAIPLGNVTAQSPTPQPSPTAGSARTYSRSEILSAIGVKTYSINNSFDISGRDKAANIAGEGVSWFNTIFDIATHSDAAWAVISFGLLSYAVMLIVKAIKKLKYWRDNPNEPMEIKITRDTFKYSK
jgi:hypothetical protein